MKISRNWLQTYFEKTLPSTEVLSDLFTFHSCEVEGVEQVPLKHIDVHNTSQADDVIDIKVLPDRAHYLLSHQGAAEEISAMTGLEIKTSYLRNNRADEAKKRVPESHTESIDVTVTDESFCSRYMSRLVTNVSVTESPAWLKNYLESVGSRSINSIVDATNFVMLDSGQPLHAFDADKVKGGIVVRLAEEGEKITTLDEKEVTLSVIDYVIADNEGPLAIAGIKGGNRAAVTTSTKNIILESAHFNPVAVRKTSKRIGIRNESSRRFENEISETLAPIGMHVVSAVISQLSPEVSFGPVGDAYPHVVTLRKISVSPSRINALLGMNIPHQDMMETLSKFNMNTDVFGHDEWHITIPHERLDVAIESDIADEIGRIVGYSNLIPTTHQELAATSDIEIPASISYGFKLKKVLSDIGYSEVYLYTLVDTGEIEIEYPLASDKSFVRSNLIDGLLVASRHNPRNADILSSEHSVLDSINIFEIGKVFKDGKEQWMLGLVHERLKKQKGVSAKQKLEETIAHVKERVGLDMLSYGSIIEKELVAYIEIPLNEYFNVNVEHNNDALDIVQSTVLKNKHEFVGFKDFSVYPFISRDIALFVPEHTDEAEVKMLITNSAASELLQKVTLFDVFIKRTENEPAKKSLAYRLVFQSFEKTLIDEEVGVIMTKITEALLQKKYEVR